MSGTGATARKRGHATLFLDVDGVLNSYPVAGLRYLKERRRKARAWAFEIHYRPQTVRALDRLVETHDVDIVWLSTWSHRCTDELEPALGFRHSFDVVPMPDDSFNRFAGDPEVWWKAIHMSAWLDEDPARRAVWVDDDLAAPATRAHFAEHYPDRLLLVAPRFSEGLLASHLRTIRDFLDIRSRRERRAARRAGRSVRARLLTGKATEPAPDAQPSTGPTTDGAATTDREDPQ